jgi:UDP-2,3-diacylglucosamine hydrolase
MPAEYADAIVISDLHLWSTDEPRYRSAIRFLRDLPREVDLLVVLGDLFDFWVGENAILVERFREVIAELAAIRARGVAVLYCEGNHDLHLERHFARTVGLDTFLGEREVRVAGRTVNLSHGDLVNPRDRGYLFLRWLLRTPLVRWLIRVTPPSLHVAIGEASSRRSRAYTAGKNDPIRELSHAYAERRVDAGADVVVIGHTHRPECVEVTSPGGRKGWYVNTGVWPVDGSRTWARIDGAGVELHHTPAPDGASP